MRYQGKVINWKDEQGFGFIRPNGGGEQVFLHIKAFSNRQRRPAVNDAVTYVLRRDANQRLRAEKVAFVASEGSSTASSGSWSGAMVFAILFVAVLIGAVYLGKLSPLALAVYAAASVAAFIAYAIDKSAARRGRWRTQESTLHLLALAGGWPGAVVAQKAFRHKTKKQSFQSMFWATVFLNCVALGIVSSPTASAAVLSLFGVRI